MRIRPDPLPNMNDGRRDFCSRYDGYGDFCTCKNWLFHPKIKISQVIYNNKTFKMKILTN